VQYNSYSSSYPMATSRQKGTLRSGFSDEDDHDDSDTAIDERTAIIEASGGDVPSTPPRRSAVFGLVTPLATPDSPSRPRSFSCRSISPPRTPAPTTQNIKSDSLTTPGEPSEHSSKESATDITLKPTAGLPTPDNTPLRNLRRSRRREDTNVSEWSPFPETSSIAVAESPET
jgi:hypothetical protein